MQPVSIVFSDIDGTLLNSSHQVTPPTIEAIRDLSSRGVPFLLVSSRSPGGIYEIQGRLGIRAPIVAFGGGLILDEEREAIHSAEIPVLLARQVKAFLREQFPGLCCCAYSYFDWIVDDPDDPWIVHEQAITGDRPVDSSPTGQGAVHKYLCMGEPERIEQAQAALRATYPDLSICRSKDTYLEVMPGQAGKGSALEFLCARYGVDPQNAAAIGDHHNDLDMFRVAGVSIAMGNAPADVKLHAKMTAPDNNHDGLATALGKLMYRPPRTRSG